MDEAYRSLSYSALSNMTGLVVMMAAWLFVRYRIKKSGVAVTHPVELMRNFFLAFGLFYVCISAPFYAVYLAPSQFGTAMAVGFTIGHAILFVAMTYTLRMTFALVPQLSNKERYVTLAGATSVLWIFTIATITMVFGTHPVYDYAKHIIDYKQAPVLAGTIALGAVVAWVPLGILFLVNAVKGHGGQRVRPLLLGSGFLLLTAVGPLHGLAQNYQQLLVADLATIFSIILIGAGVVYKINTSLAETPKP